MMAGDASIEPMGLQRESTPPVASLVITDTEKSVHRRHLAHLWKMSEKLLGSTVWNHVGAS